MGRGERGWTKELQTEEITCAKAEVRKSIVYLRRCCPDNMEIIHEVRRGSDFNTTNLVELF